MIDETKTEVTARIAEHNENVRRVLGTALSEAIIEEEASLIKHFRKDKKFKDLPDDEITLNEAPWFESQRRNLKSEKESLEEGLTAQTEQQLAKVKQVIPHAEAFRRAIYDTQAPRIVIPDSDLEFSPSSIPGMTVMIETKRHGAYGVGVESVVGSAWVPKNILTALSALASVSRSPS